MPASRHKCFSINGLDANAREMTNNRTPGAGGVAGHAPREIFIISRSEKIFFVPNRTPYALINLNTSYHHHIKPNKPKQFPLHFHPSPLKTITTSNY
jgi:hypothetical protein